MAGVGGLRAHAGPAVAGEAAGGRQRDDAVHARLGVDHVERVLLLGVLDLPARAGRGSRPPCAAARPRPGCRAGRGRGRGWRARWAGAVPRARAGRGCARLSMPPCPERNEKPVTRRMRTRRLRSGVAWMGMRFGPALSAMGSSGPPLTEIATRPRLPEPVGVRREVDVADVHRVAEREVEVAVARVLGVGDPGRVRVAVHRRVGPELREQREAGRARRSRARSGPSRQRPCARPSPVPGNGS